MHQLADHLGMGEVFQPVHAQLEQAHLGRQAVARERGSVQLNWQLVEAGTSPSDVAAPVVDAIRDERFYVLPHPEWPPLVRQQHERQNCAGGESDGRRRTPQCGWRSRTR